MKRFLTALIFFPFFLVIHENSTASPPVSPSIDIIGITLFMNLSLPECNSKSTFLKDIYNYDVSPNNIPCWQHRIMDKGKAREAPPATGKLLAILTSASLPKGVKYKGTELLIVDRIIQGVDIETHGYNVQDSLMSLLKEKYGEPTTSDKTVVQNRFGVEFVRQDAKWIFSNLIVNFIGFGSYTDLGLITVYTPKGVEYVLQRAEEKEKSRPRL